MYQARKKCRNAAAPTLKQPSQTPNWAEPLNNELCRFTPLPPDLMAGKAMPATFPMTSEIAILNKSAVALAADSAVTIQNQRGAKVYNTVNKLFTLSKYAPVGVMIYGDAELSGVPWETIIKAYRTSLGKQRFAKLDQHASHFITFLHDHKTLFPIALQTASLKQTVIPYATALLEQRAKPQAAKESHAIPKAFGLVVAAELEGWRRKTRLATAPKGIEDQIRIRHKDSVFGWVKEVLPEAESSTLDSFLELVVEMHVRDAFGPRQSGIVVAGFGSDDYFPQMQTFLFDGYLEGVPKFREDPGKAGRIDANNSACITPFAQSDDALTFITGMAPNYGRLLDGLLTGLFGSFGDALKPVAASIQGIDHQALERSLATHGETAKKRFREELQRFQQETHVGPILNMVSVLPKDELAVMAESLVHLTTLKKRFTMDTESVGGPVDVAVISKGDGFVWIKRKHYFDIKYNPHFSQNYFRSADEESP